VLHTPRARAVTPPARAKTPTTVKVVIPTTPAKLPPGTKSPAQIAKEAFQHH
jgi:hypothetical protein